jgi:hypothetical protein
MGRLGRKEQTVKLSRAAAAARRFVRPRASLVPAEGPYWTAILGSVDLITPFVRTKQAKGRGSEVCTIAYAVAARA